MSREPVTEADVDDIALSGEPPLVRAKIFERWAEESHPDDDYTRADLLVSAAGEWGLAGEHARAVDCCRRAMAAGAGVRFPDLRIHLHAHLLAAGLTDEAAELERAMRRTPPTEALDFEYVAETYEARGDLRTAARWFTIGLDRVPDEDGRLLVGRFRVRRAAGLPLDGIDEEALEEFPDIYDWLDWPGA